MTNIVILSVEGFNSNTEVNFFNGMGYMLPNTNLKCYAIGKHSRRENAENKFKLVLQKAKNFLENHALKKIIFLFVGDFDSNHDKKCMQETMYWLKEFIETNKKIIFKNIDVVVIDKIYGDENHSIESSLTRVGLKLNDKKIKKETNHNLFNNAIEGTNWMIDNNFNINNAIESLKLISSQYVELLSIIKDNL